MTYIHITKTPDHSLADYQRVVRAIGDVPIPGRRRHLAGEQDGALFVFDEWESRAHADRFATHLLFPAFEQAGLTPSPSTTIIAFEAGVGDA